MRRLILTLLVAGGIACESSTGTESSVISVVVRDDRGAPVDRMPVSATLSSTRVDASTRGDGRAEIRVPEPGTYLVRVLPRAGYVGSTPALSKSVTVDDNVRATVDFTVHREGVSTADPRPEG
jgi:hypothetical protein